MNICCYFLNNDLDISQIQHNAHVGSLIALELAILHHNDVMPSAINRQTFLATSTTRWPVRFVM